MSFWGILYRSRITAPLQKTKASQKPPKRVQKVESMYVNSIDIINALLVLVPKQIVTRKPGEVGQEINMRKKAWGKISSFIFFERDSPY